MTDQILPVLTPDEWRDALTSIGGITGYDSAVGDSPEVCAYLIALNNAALPAKSLYKITQEDVLLLRDAMGACARFASVAGANPIGEDGKQLAATARRLYGLSARLNALLPPEPA